MTIKLIWEKPAPRVDHAVITSQLRLRPGHWGRIDKAYTYQSAKNMASRIRGGAMANYSPAGAFDAKVRKVEEHFYLFVRYLGDGVSDD